MSLQVIRKVSEASKTRTYSVYPAVGYLTGIDATPAAGHLWPVLWARVVHPLSETPCADLADAAHFTISSANSASDLIVSTEVSAPEFSMRVAIGPHVFHDRVAFCIQGILRRGATLGFLPLDVFLGARLG